MPRQPDGSEPRSERLTVRLTPAGIAAIRRVLRDGESIGAFVRAAISAEVRRRA